MDITNKRLITDKEGAFLYGMSVNSFRELSKRIGADVHLGRKKLNKKAPIDNWIDSLPSGADLKPAGCAGTSQQLDQRKEV